ncbi:Hypothetical protein POVN_LOCUS221 [uncultured virus]|nr:Hypothetical protein POVN_LOCUS221 [uncultured virus]
MDTTSNFVLQLTFSAPVKIEFKAFHAWCLENKDLFKKSAVVHDELFENTTFDCSDMVLTVQSYNAKMMGRSWDMAHLIRLLVLYVEDPGLLAIPRADTSTIPCAHSGFLKPWTLCNICKAGYAAYVEKEVLTTFSSTASAAETKTGDKLESKSIKVTGACGFLLHGADDTPFGLCDGLRTMPHAEFVATVTRRKELHPIIGRALYYPKTREVDISILRRAVQPRGRDWWSSEPCGFSR